jgi:L-cysteine:1D-myo-inositol 2-amino-2-deoxy-alpha-D-glucopyranoside ligase
VKSWPEPHIPRLPGTGLPLRLFDTASQEIRTTEPGPTARMYVCGITPYDATHMGHAFTYVTFDLINRAWRDAGYDVHYVQNVTDIDDPLLERAIATGQDWQERHPAARLHRCSRVDPFRGRSRSDAAGEGRRVLRRR